MLIDKTLMPMELDGVDFSDYFVYTEQDEAKRKVYGPNHGRVTLDATLWTDLRGVKHDLSARTMPMSPDKLAQLGAILDKPYFSLTTFSWWKNDLWTRNVVVDGAPAVLAMIKAAGTRPILANIPITFVEK